MSIQELIKLYNQYLSETIKERTKHWTDLEKGGKKEILLKGDYVGLLRSMKKYNSCQRCGNCCRTDTLLKSCSLPMRIFLRIIYFLKGKSIKTTLCRNLTFKNGLAFCKIYESRPKFCRDYYCK